MSAALASAQEATEELASTEIERVQRRFGIVVARMELKRLWKEGESNDDHQADPAAV